MADTTTSVGELRDRVRQFVHARDWERFHAPKDLAMAISIEASELLERFLWRGAGTPAELSSEDRSAIGEELADVLIYSLSLANTLRWISPRPCSRSSRRTRRNIRPTGTAAGHVESASEGCQETCARTLCRDGINAPRCARPTHIGPP